MEIGLKSFADTGLDTFGIGNIRGLFLENQVFRQLKRETTFIRHCHSPMVAQMDSVHIYMIFIM